MERARPDVEYRTLAMDTVCEEDPAKFQELMKRLSARRIVSDAGSGGPHASCTRHQKMVSDTHQGEGAEKASKLRERQRPSGWA